MEMTSASDFTVAEHFEGRVPAVRAIYDRILEAAKRLGPVREEPKKTSIHLARKTAFAGVATRKKRAHPHPQVRDGPAEPQDQQARADVRQPVASRGAAGRSGAGGR